MFCFSWIPDSQDYRDYSRWQPVGAWTAAVVEHVPDGPPILRLASLNYDWVRGAPFWVALGERRLRKLAYGRSRQFCSTDDRRYGRVAYSFGRYLASLRSADCDTGPPLMPEIGIAFTGLSLLDVDIEQARRWLQMPPSVAASAVLQRLEEAAMPPRSQDNPMPYPVLPAKLVRSGVGVRMLVERWTGRFATQRNPLQSCGEQHTTVTQLLSDIGIDRSQMLQQLMSGGCSGETVELQRALGRIRSVLGEFAQFAEEHDVLESDKIAWKPLLERALATLPTVRRDWRQGQRDLFQAVQLRLRQLALPFVAALGHPGDWEQLEQLRKFRLAATLPQQSGERPWWLVID